MPTVGSFLFRYRGYLPIPFVLLVLFLSRPSSLTTLLGTPLALVGELLRLWAVAYSGPSTRSRSIQAETLTTAGPYAHLRHPIYLGNLIISLGFLICFNSWMPYMLIPLLFLFSFSYGVIVKAEEEYLREKFGVKYLSYAKDVPAFLPKIRPYTNKYAKPPDLRGALRSERETFQAIAGAYLLLISRWAVRSSLGV